MPNPPGPLTKCTTMGASTTTVPDRSRHGPGYYNPPATSQPSGASARRYIGTSARQSSPPRPNPVAVTRTTPTCHRNPPGVCHAPNTNTGPLLGPRRRKQPLRLLSATKTSEPHDEVPLRESPTYRQQQEPVTTPPGQATATQGHLTTRCLEGPERVVRRAPSLVPHCPIPHSHWRQTSPRTRRERHQTPANVNRCTTAEGTATSQNAR